MNSQDRINVEEALEAAYEAGASAGYADGYALAKQQHSRNYATNWQEAQRREFLQVIHAVGQSIQANSQGLTALAQTLDNWRTPA